MATPAGNTNDPAHPPAAGSEGRMALMVVQQMFAGRIRDFGGEGRESAVAKQAVPGPWAISRQGLEGDEHADNRHHGGPDKALHHYCFDHYAHWAQELPAAAECFRDAPGFGENISIPG